MCATQPTWFLLKAPVAELPAALGMWGMVALALRWLKMCVLAAGCGVERVVDHAWLGVILWGSPSRENAE